MSLFTSAIPLPYRIGAIALVLTLLVGGSVWYGYRKGSARADIVIAEYSTRVAKLSNDIAEVQVRVVDRIVTVYVDKIIKIKEVETHNVQVANDVVPDKSVLSNGWVYTHDAAAASTDADTTRSADATPSGVEANQALSTVVANYGSCAEVRNQLIGLQDWVTDTLNNIKDQNANNKKSK